MSFVVMVAVILFRRQDCVLISNDVTILPIVTRRKSLSFEHQLQQMNIHESDSARSEVWNIDQIQVCVIIRCFDVMERVVVLHVTTSFFFFYAKEQADISDQRPF